MKYIKLDLLTLLIGLFIFSACEKKGTIGLDISPMDSIKSVLTEIPVLSSTVRDDSVLTSSNSQGVSQNIFGIINDPIFGRTEASLALGLSLPSDGFSFGSSRTIDSAVLVLRYGNEFYGDSLTSNYSINVNQLQSAYNTAKNYYSTSSWGNSSNLELLGSLNNVKRFTWNDTINVVTLVKGGPDTVLRVPPQIRIRLNSSFINKLLNADSASLRNNTVFANYIKGLYLTINKDQSSGTGGLISFDLASTSSSVEVYYKSQNATSSAIDTNRAVFKITGSSSIRHNREGTEVEAQLLNPENNNAKVYVQPLGGVRTRLRFPELNRLRDEQGNISINKAELIIKAVEGFEKPFKPALRLTLYRLDIAGQRRPVPDNAIGVDRRFLDERIFGGYYNKTDSSYRINITSYVHDLVNKPETQFDTFIAPFSYPLSGAANILPSASTAARSILGGGANVGNAMKLRIIYTKPN